MFDSQASIVGSPAQGLPRSVSNGNHVAVLLCTLDGETHLPAQLESIAAQTHTDWTLWVSDDGSTDATLQVIEAFKNNHPKARVQVVQGPKAGFAANYMSLVHSPTLVADYFAFCDQDDIWLPKRLEASIQALRAAGPAPALYCARTEYINAAGAVLGESRAAPAECTFARALAHNVCGGNTMMVNAAARALMQQVPGNRVAAHDWLAYLLVSAAGGTLVYDPSIFVQYRQHPGNAMGENRSLAARWHRLRRLWAGDLRRWTDLNMQALDCIPGALTPENRMVLARFRQARAGAPWTRMQRLRASGVRREGAAAQLAYSLALAFGQV